MVSSEAFTAFTAPSNVVKGAGVFANGGGAQRNARGILGSAPFPTKTSACIETAGRTKGASSFTTCSKAVITAADTPSSAAAASVNVRP